MTDNRKQRKNTQRGLSDQIFDLIQDSIDSMDFSGLNDRIRETVEDTREEIYWQLGNLQNNYYRGSARNGSKGHGPNQREVHRAGGNSRAGATSSPFQAGSGQHTAIVESGMPKRQLPGTYSGPVQMFLGGTGLAVFGAASLGVGLAAIGFGLAGGIVSAGTIAAESILLPLSAISGIFLGRGIFTRNRVRRLKDYINLWKGRSYIMLSDLREKTGQSDKQIRQDIQYLTDNRLLPGARMDQQETCLMLTDEAIQQYEAAAESRRQREAEEEARRKQAEEEARQQASQWEQASEEERDMLLFAREAESVLTQLGHYRQEIASPVVRDRLDRLELLLTRIFVCVKEHPEKLRLTSRLMDYYVPSVLKLLSVYEDMENQPIQGENIQKTLREIEASMDTINEALETMFDELFAAEAMDVSADIQVLHTMLARDGWIDKPLTASSEDIFS